MDSFNNNNQQKFYYVLAGGERAIEVQRRVLRDRIRHVQKKLEGEVTFRMQRTRAVGPNPTQLEETVQGGAVW